MKSKFAGEHRIIKIRNDGRQHNMIKIENLCKSFDGSEVLKSISVEINKGDVISVIGPSGCGKSTLLRCINMLAPPTSGRIFVDGEEITAESSNLSKLRRKMGMVFQNFNLFNHMTVIENVMLAQVDLMGKDRQSAYDYGMELLDNVGLGSKAMSYPESLSGGQKQRAAIARALAMDPEIILFDEPTSALDPTMVNEVKGVIQRLAEKGMTMFIVTHDMDFAENIANRVFYMDEKGIYEDGTPDQIFRYPQKPKTRAFIYRESSLNYEIHGRDFDFYELMGQAVEFMKKHRFADKRIREIVLLGEELILNQVFPAIGTDMFDITVTLRYSEKLNKAEIILAGDDIRADIFDIAGDKISGMIINQYAENIDAQDGCLTVEIQL